MSCTFSAKVNISSVTHTGTYDDCRKWVENLAGCDITAVGRDGETYLIGVVTSAETTNLDAVRR